MNSDNLKLGHIIEPDRKADRDAVHIAVAPAIAGEWLRPGERVGLKDGEASHYAEKLIGIVDPFLRDAVSKKQRFWIFLDPGTITSLRHDWKHPAFAAIGGEAAVTPESTVSGDESRQWIEALAIEVGQTYDDLIEAADLWVRRNEYTYDNSEKYKRVDYDKWPVFWRHWEIVTGRKHTKHEDTFFTCSC